MKTLMDRFVPHDRAREQRGLDRQHQGLRVAWLVLPVLVIMAICGSGPGQAADRRIALVVGNAAYDQARLPAARASADSIDKALRAVGVEVTRADNLDQQAMLAALDRFRRSLAGAELGIFYYSGLTLSVGERGILLPVGTRVRSVHDLDLDGVDLDKALGVMQGAGRPLVAIFDSAGSHPLITRLAKTVAEGGAPVLASLPVPAGLPQSLIVYSHRPDAVPTSPGSGATVFSQALADVMTTPGQSLRDGLSDVARKVGEASRGGQHPWLRDQRADGASLVLLARDGQLSKSGPPQPEPSSPTPRLEVMDEKRKVSRDLNLRAAPNNRAAVLAVLRADSEVRVIGRPQGASGWLQVEQDGKVGYVTGSYLLSGAETPSAPVVASTPPIDTSLDSAQTGLGLSGNSAGAELLQEGVDVVAGQPRAWEQARNDGAGSGDVTADINQEPYRSAVAAARQAATAAAGGSDSRAARGRAMAEQAERAASAAQDAASQAPRPFQYGNGDDYRGQWAGNRKHGVGIYRFADGQVFAGEWVDDQMGDVAVITFANGDRFAGTLINGVPDGVGVFQFANGQSYAGDIRAGRLEGLGELRYGNGDLFRGQVVNGQANGNGELLRRDGIRHLGRFQRGIQDGPGGLGSGDAAPLLPGIWRGGASSPGGISD